MLQHLATTWIPNHHPLTQAELDLMIACEMTTQEEVQLLLDRKLHPDKMERLRQLMELVTLEIKGAPRQ